MERGLIPRVVVAQTACPSAIWSSMAWKPGRLPGSVVRTGTGSRRGRAGVPRAARPSDPWTSGQYGATLNRMVQSPAPRVDPLDIAFAALADPTRRGILERLGRGDASITELAAGFAMTLTGVKKHIGILEAAGLVTTEKVGRVRRCRLGPRRLEAETAWIQRYRQQLEARLDRLGEFLELTKGARS